MSAGAASHSEAPYPPDASGDAFTGYWQPVADADPSRWLVIASPWSVAAEYAHKRVTLLTWPDAYPGAWLTGPDAVLWWLPLFGRRVLLLTGSLADDALAFTVRPLLARHAARVVHRSV